MLRRASIALAAVATLVTGSLAATLATADEPPSPPPQSVSLKFLNGSGNKNVIYGEQRQPFTGAVPWTLAADPAILAPPTADGGEPRYFGGRQRIGVASDGESGGRLDSISAGETLVLARGDVLVQEGRLFDGVSLNLNGSGVAEISATRNGTVVGTESVTIGNGDGAQPRLSITTGVLFDGVEFDAIELTASAGFYGIKGFTESVFSLTASSTVVVEGELKNGETLEATNGVQSAAVQCVAGESPQDCEGQVLQTEITVRGSESDRSVDVTFPGKPSDVDTPVLKLVIEWGPTDFPLAVTVFDPNIDDTNPGQPVEACADVGLPVNPGENCLLTFTYTPGGNLIEEYRFISDPRWLR